MGFDPTTEIIAHFIGAFHMQVEAERLRDDFEKFTALKAEELDFGPLLNINVNVAAGYRLEDFTPRMSPLKAATDAPAARFAPGYPYLLGHDAAPLLMDSFPLGAPYLPVFFLPYLPAEPIFTIEPPGSFVTIIIQGANLSDNDLMTYGLGIDFAAPSAFDAELEGLVNIAMALQGFDPGPLPDLSESAMPYAEAFVEMVQQVENPGLEGAEVSILRQEEAQGTHQNGALIEEIPQNLKELLPAFLQQEDAAEEGTEMAPESAEETPEAPPEIDGPPEDDGPSLDFFDVEPGHSVVTGANQMFNETYIGLNWLDAPVISVAGDVVSVDSISQANVLVDHNVVTVGTPDMQNTVLNMATISQTSSAALIAEAEAEAAAAVEDDSDDGTEAEAEAEASAAAGEAEADASAGSPGMSFPETWAVARIEANVIAVNWVQQFSFATDMDMAEVVFTGAETLFEIGGNIISNAAGLLEIGFGYDLIMIGGNMINISAISQTNVLLDNDWITGSGEGTPGSVNVADNTLINSASLTTVGIDTYSGMTDIFANQTEAFAEGAQTLSEDVAHQSLFTGVDLLRALYIDGDFTTLNLIEQTNILGDVDQVHLAFDQMAGVDGAEVNVTAGSNALLNVAAVSEFGTDSTVMVGGEVYSEALLYQAELIDTDADPLGVNIAGLASEAVAFLAEDMIDPEMLEETILPTTAADVSSTPDLMQTMLA